MELKKINLKNEPVFIYVAGTIGAGKSYFIKKYLNQNKDLNVLDIDDLRVEFQERGYIYSEAVSAAIKGIKEKLQIYFNTLTSCINSGAVSNYKGTKNKFKQAKKAGFITVLIYIDTPTELAINQNKKKFLKTGFGIDPNTLKGGEKIEQLNLELPEKINKLIDKKYVDFYLKIKNTY